MSFLSKNKKYELFPSENAPLLYPALQYSAYLFFEDGTSTYIPFSVTHARVWGSSGGVDLLNNDNMFALPERVEIAWLSVLENKFYGVRVSLPKERIQELLEMKDPETQGQQFKNIVFGMAPYGGLAVWLTGGTRNIQHTIEIAWIQGEEADINFSDWDHGVGQTCEEFCEWALQYWYEEADDNLKVNGLPDRELFNNYMSKFNYRIVPVFEKPETEYKVSGVRYYNGEISAVHYDIGEYNLEDILIRYDLYQPKAKPYKINILWKAGKDVYDGYFWTDEKKIIDAFSKFYGDNTSKDGNLIIEVAESNDQFKFSLQDASAIVEIPVEDMQFIIFKNKIEFYRSENYNRPQGGWRD